MATKAQLASRDRNFAIFRLRGAKAMFANLYIQMDLPEGKEGMDLCGRAITRIKSRGGDK